MARIAIAGFQHETNTFAPLKATFQHFVESEGWPALTRGERILEVFPKINLPAGGFILEATRLGHSLVPIVWAAATASSFSHPFSSTEKNKFCDFQFLHVP